MLKVFNFFLGLSSCFGIRCCTPFDRVNDGLSNDIKMSPIRVKFDAFPVEIGKISFYEFFVNFSQK